MSDKRPLIEVEEGAKEVWNVLTSDEIVSKKNWMALKYETEDKLVIAGEGEGGIDQGKELLNDEVIFLLIRGCHVKPKACVPISLVILWIPYEIQGFRRAKAAFHVDHVVKALNLSHFCLVEAAFLHDLKPEVILEKIGKITGNQSGRYVFDRSTYDERRQSLVERLEKEKIIPSPGKSLSEVNVFQEILSTEQTYVRSLKLFMEKYVIPMKDVAPPAFYSAVHRNIKLILDINEPFLQKLEECYNTRESIIHREKQQQILRTDQIEQTEIPAHVQEEEEEDDEPQEEQLLIWGGDEDEEQKEEEKPEEESTTTTTTTTDLTTTTTTTATTTTTPTTTPTPTEPPAPSEVVATTTPKPEAEPQQQEGEGEKKTGGEVNEMQKDRVAKMVEILVEQCPIFKLYLPFVNEYTKLLEQVKELMTKNKKFGGFCDEVRRELQINNERNTDIYGFLIMPIQRIPRYQLLMKELHKNTQPSDPNYARIEEGLRSVGEIARYVDVKKEESEMSFKTIEIAQKFKLKDLMDMHRKMKKFSQCKIRKEQGEICVFNDILLIIMGRKVTRVSLMNPDVRCYKNERNEKSLVVETERKKHLIEFILKETVNDFIHVIQATLSLNLGHAAMSNQYMTRPLFSSLLKKEGGGKFSYSIKKRWHVLTADMKMKYYDKPNGKMKGSYTVIGAKVGKGKPVDQGKKKKGLGGLLGRKKKKIAEKEEAKEDGQDFWFYIETARRTYYLIAEDVLMLETWLQVLEMIGCSRDDRIDGKEKEWQREQLDLIKKKKFETEGVEVLRRQEEGEEKSQSQPEQEPQEPQQPQQQQPSPSTPQDGDKPSEATPSEAKPEGGGGGEEAGEEKKGEEDVPSVQQQEKEGEEDGVIKEEEDTSGKVPDGRTYPFPDVSVEEYEEFLQSEWLYIDENAEDQGPEEWESFKALFFEKKVSLKTKVFGGDATDYVPIETQPKLLAALYHDTPKDKFPYDQFVDFKIVESKKEEENDDDDDVEEEEEEEEEEEPVDETKGEGEGEDVKKEEEVVEENVPVEPVVDEVKKED